MQRLGERFLAGTGCALQQDRHLLGEQLAAAGEVLAHLRIFADVLLDRVRRARRLAATVRCSADAACIGGSARRALFDGARTSAKKRRPWATSRTGQIVLGSLLRALFERFEVELEEIG